MSTPPTDIPGPLFDAVIEALVAGPASLDQVVQAVAPGGPADPEQDPAWKVSSLITQCVQVALPIVLASRDSETAEEFPGFYITNDDGYPALTYYHGDVDADGVHVKTADAGTSLDELVQAARKHAASLRGEQ